MTDKADHVAWAAEAVAVFQRHCRTGDEHAIADLICDLGHLAEQRGLDFLSEVKRGIGHWYTEHHAGDGERLGPDAAVEISIAASERQLLGELRKWPAHARTDVHDPYVCSRFVSTTQVTLASAPVDVVATAVVGDCQDLVHQVLRLTLARESVRAAKILNCWRGSGIPWLWPASRDRHKWP